MVKKFIQASLFVFVCSGSSTLFAETNRLLADNLTLLIQHVQDLEKLGITTNHIIEHCSTPCNNHSTSTILSLEAQKLLGQHLHELGIHGITRKQIIDYCAALAKQKELDKDNTNFYEKFVWIGVGSLIAAGVVILTYIALRGNNKEVNQDEADHARRDRIARDGYRGEDVKDGFANIDRIINDLNQDLALRRIIAQAVGNVRIAQNPLSNDELRAIPIETFHRAGAIIQDNMFGWNGQRTVEEVNNLIDRHMGR